MSPLVVQQRQSLDKMPPIAFRERLAQQVIENTLFTQTVRVAEQGLRLRGFASANQAFDDSQLGVLHDIFREELLRFIHLPVL